MKLIGLGHRKHSGKDTVADYLIKKHAPNAEKVSWADALKEGVGRRIFGFNDRQLYGDLKEVVDPRWGKTPREVLQYVGTDLFRAWIPDIWIKAALYYIDDNLSDCDLVVIPDCRFPNEAEAVKERGGRVYRVDRPSLGPTPAAAHESERALLHWKEWDGVIENVSTKNALYRRVDAVLG
jgi:hypothetical protein